MYKNVFRRPPNLSCFLTVTDSWPLECHFFPHLWMTSPWISPPCGIYRHGRPAYVRRRICLNYFISHDFLLSVSPSTIRALVHVLSPCYQRNRSISHHGKNILRLSSYLLSREESLMPFRHRFVKPTPLRTFTYHERTREIGMISLYS